MPTNKKEGLIFTCLMCSMMVLGMSAWNLFLNNAFEWSHLALGFLPGFIVAGLLDILLVGPIAKKIAFSVLPENIERKIFIALTISGLMVLGMVSFMSIYGIVVNGAEFTISNYARTWGMNFVMALPLNLIIVGPISRAILGKVQANSVPVEASAE